MLNGWLNKAARDIFISLLAFPISPVIALISMKGEIPSQFNYWLTHDNDVDGDSGHWERWPDNGTRWRVFCRRTAWLWRNKGYTYSYEVSGVVPEGDITYKGTPLFWTKENPKGWCFAKCDNAWMLFAWFPYSVFGFKKGIRIYLGWKLRYYCEHPDKPKREMLVTHINPFKNKI